MSKQQRVFLLLKNDPTSLKAQEVLKSPLELAEALIVDFIEKKLDTLKQRLDSIKQFAAGIKAAEEKSNDYILAKFYPYYFAFHQFVHSSFRARQGKVLEELFKSLLREHPEYKIEILDKNHQKKELGTNKNSLPDFDLFLKINSEFLVIIQIRSRDDTGGTTAKTSLVEGLAFLKENANTNLPIYYIVFVWEELNSAQKKTTINKFFNFLKEKLLPTNTSKEYFSDEILSRKGVFLNIENNKMYLHLIYGKNEFVNFLKNLLNLDDSITSEFEKLIEITSNWDDLWISYSIIGKEYERFKERGESFIFDIIEFIKKKNYSFQLNNYKQIEAAADLIASDFIKECQKKAPFDTPKDNYLYFRDIVFLLAIYYKKKSF